MDEDIQKIDEQIQSMTEKPEEEPVVFEEISNTKTVETISDLKEEENEEVQEEPVEVLEEAKTEGETPPEEVKPEHPTPAPSPKKKNHIVIWVLVAGIVILCLIFIGVLVVTRTPKKEKTDKKELTAAEKKQIIQEYGEALQGVISVYYEQKEVLLNYEDAILLVKYDYEVVCDEHEIYEDGKIYLNECSIDEEEVTYSYGKKQEKQELKEGAIKVYVSKENGKATLKEPSNVKDYDTYSFDIDGKYSSLTLLGSKSDYVVYMDEKFYVHIMNYKKREKALPDEDYEQVVPIQYNGEFDQHYVAVEKNSIWGVYNLDTEERTVTIKYNSLRKVVMGTTGPTLSLEAVGDGILCAVIYNGNNAKFGTINYRTGKELIPVENRIMYMSGKYLFVRDVYGKGHLFEPNGNELLVNKFDDILYAVEGKFVLVNDHDEIKIVSDLGNEIYNYGKIKIGTVNYGLSYKSGAAFNATNPDADNEDLDKGCMELLYDPATKTGEVKEHFCGGIAKPILYLYPKKTTKVIVTFEHPEFLETTYPKYIDRWEVTAKKNGDLTDSNGKSYYALYWDEAKVHPVDFHTGFYVTKEDAISFLEEKLTYIGLNDHERNEFIMYWLPVLEKNGQSLVYFELTEERESYSKIHITPEPDSLLRLVIHIKKVDHKVNIPKENLSKFNRKGFVAVEWGGTTY